MAGLQVDVILEHQSSGDRFRGTIPVPGSTSFTNLPSGAYTVTYHVPSRYRFTGKNPDYIAVGAGQTITLGLTVEQFRGAEKETKTQSRKPPVKAIASFALGAALVGNMGGLEAVIKDALAAKPPAQPSPTAPAPRGSLPAAVTTKLKDCLQARAIELSGVPTLGKLLAELSWERQASSDFEYQLMQLYTRSQQLRSLISSCDPALLQELMAARQKAFPDDRVVVIRETATAIESDGSGAYFQISVPFGTEFDLDHEALDQLPAAQQAALDSFEGWLPVIFANGRSGFVDRASVRRQIAPPQI